MAAPSPRKSALTHPLNVLLLAGAGVSALLTGTWIPLAVAGACELLWLTLGPKLPAQRRYFELLARDAGKAEAIRGEQALVRELGEADRKRFLELDRLRQDIARLTNENPSLSMDMMKGELTKVDHLVGAFLRMAAETTRLEAFLETSDLDALEADVRRQRAVVEKTADPDARATAAENLELMEARLLRAAEMRRRVREQRGQLQLVENTMALLRDQVATMKTPEEIAGRLDELVQTVDVIEATAKETEAIGRPQAVRLRG